ncbi:MAG TPA: divalent-cation tolerance protein CutA [Rubrivivax sp.]|nr:divalent-cation tolerance protein CutA [Rubrivivax sp.]
MHAQTPLPWLVVTTVGTAADAQRLARAAVAQRLAACAQVEAIDSVYRWQGAVHEEAEYRILFKTAPARVDALMAALRAAHPYELPALHAWPVRKADPAYAAWVSQGCDDGVDGA